MMEPIGRSEGPPWRWERWYARGALDIVMVSGTI